MGESEVASKMPESKRIVAVQSDPEWVCRHELSPPSCPCGGDEGSVSKDHWKTANLGMRELLGCGHDSFSSARRRIRAGGDLRAGDNLRADDDFKAGADPH